MPRSLAVPARIAWAVELLQVAPDDRILEIGSGPGVAAGLVGALLGPAGRLTAIDRSATAVERGRTRNAALVESGRLTFHRVDLAHLEPALLGAPGPTWPEGGLCDKAFAVNVNLFWTTTARTECALLRSLLVPGGAVHLVYGGTGPGERHEVAPGIVAKLERAGLEPEAEIGPDGRSVRVTGRRVG